MGVRRKAAAGVALALGVTLVPAAEAKVVASPENRFAVLVGITDYRSPTKDTVGGVGDVETVRKVLLNRGWRNDRIMVLTDEQATGARIRSGMQWLVDNSRAGQTFSFFHYSGHVKQNDGHERLWPIDREFIADTTVASTLGKIRGSSWVNISGCEAGGFAESLPDSDTLFTASSGRYEKSYEHPDWKKSIWSGLVFDAGIHKGKADADGDKKVSVQEAVQYAAPIAKQMTAAQRPYGRQTPVVLGDKRSLNLAAPRV
ncbi:MAG: caspase family protein [Mycobacteriales bacterium]|nr:caspase family protein [Mycobacteriales bacterium]